MSIKRGSRATKVYLNNCKLTILIQIIIFDQELRKRTVLSQFGPI